MLIKPMNQIKTVIGKNNIKIGAFCIIEEDVYIGKNVIIENYVYLSKGTVIGDNCFIDSYAKSSGDCSIGDNCIIRYGATIAKDVEIGNNVFISPNVMTIYSDPDGKHSNSTIIQDGAFIGTAAVINAGVNIAERVVIGAMSYVNMNCNSVGGIYIGQPAKFKGLRNE